jgi:uncharacterized SAM-binding protein YcdF (DUF218 family)
MIQARLEEDIALIWGYLAAAQAPQPSDAFFVFGGLDMAVPRHAAALYLEGLSDLVLVTGNAGLLSKSAFDAPEAIVFQREMIRLGVPEKNILTETRATNTQENVVFGTARLRAHCPAAHSLLLVAKPFLMRRCIATFQKHAPDFSLISSPPPGDWHAFVDRNMDDFVRRLPAELTRLEEYPQKGFIAPVSIPAEVREAAQRISAEFK